MAKCPECGADVEYLDYAEMTSCGGKYSRGFNYFERWKGGSEEIFFSCPECCAELFYNDTDADSFLDGTPYETIVCKTAAI